ncbi:MAG: DUF1848 domain-containing protein [Oscillospiraceae bacterium]|nr:DUF1848 domain-containing protein [Oscillospiraceae bacterium]
MIVSASRRTDIPAFHTKWLLNRLDEGFALTENPRNPKKLSHIPLEKGVTDIIWFWSKNPSPLLQELDNIDRYGIPYAFQFTLTPCGPAIEPGTSDKDKLIRTFLALSERLGPERVVWRYDPILMTDGLSAEEHIRLFSKLAHILNGSTERCILSFLDIYTRNKTPLAGRCRPPFEEESLRIAEGFSEAAAKNGIRLFTCSEEMDLARFGIGHASCIDKELTERIIGAPIKAKKAPGQRPLCGCIESSDIGAYDTCPMGCRYCYATMSPEAVKKRLGYCDPASPLLCGQVNGREVIRKEWKSLIENQLTL